ncbi:DUF4832 domain-containing protein [Streptococcus anginosus]|uniref:DUF4832 domain-containing protein n=1 Tax=Streptococcus anginosus TaxID=1328 RepID=UPI00046CD4BA|nr:DUF4832 domain-containing protein [Streptococcus anginosus]MDP1385830.1 DUF4832 domain-containing protein [Streptococcus anginosus]
MNKIIPICLVVLVVLFICIAFSSPVKKSRKRVEQNFTYSDKALSNPLMGYAPSARESEVSRDIQLVYMDVTWKELEPQKGVYAWKILEEKNQLKRWLKEGKHVVLRFVLDYPQAISHEDIPSWLIKEMSDPGDRYISSYGKGFSPNYEDKKLIHYYEKAVTEMGRRWANSGQISFIELGALGHWGEWHVNDEANIRKLPEAAIREKYITPWIDAFPEANILMRRPFAAAKKYGFGLYNDVVGDEESKKVWLNWIQSGGDYDQENAKNGLVPMPDAWQTAPIGGELTSSATMKTLMGKKLKQIIKELQESHTTFLGPKIAEMIDNDDSSYNELLKNMGYRLWIPQMTLTSSKKFTQLSITFANKGVAPFYRNWKVKIYVFDRMGAIIESKTVPIDLTKISPNKEQKVQISLSTANVTGEGNGCKIALGIVSPLTKKPAVHFANKGQERQKLLTLYED